MVRIIQILYSCLICWYIFASVLSIVQLNIAKIILNLIFLCFNTCMYYHLYYKKYANTGIKVKCYNTIFKSKLIKDIIKILPNEFKKYNAKIYVVGDKKSFDELWNKQFYTIGNLININDGITGGFFSATTKEICLFPFMAEKKEESLLMFLHALLHELKHLDQCNKDGIHNALDIRDKNYNNQEHEVDANKFAETILRDKKTEIMEILRRNFNNVSKNINS